MKRIAILTPISHLKGIKDLLFSKSNQLFFNETASREEVRELLLTKEIDTILCNPNQQSYKINAELLDNTQVNLINTCSTGLNHIDLKYCESKKIEIQCHKNDYELINQLPSTSELAFGLMMSLLRNILACNNHVSRYSWDYTQFMGRQVKDLRIGIIGYGRLGKMMKKYCDAFDAHTYVYDPYVNIEQTPLEDMFEICDVISLHVHVTDETKYMINEKLLGEAKNSPYIINTSRGEIVKEKDIVKALKNKTISGYGTDVIEDEFGNLKNSPIIKAMNEGENIIVTPHIGGMTIEGQTKAYKWSINKL